MRSTGMHVHEGLAMGDTLFICEDFAAIDRHMSISHLGVAGHGKTVRG
jgi:hypothetical protein